MARHLFEGTGHYYAAGLLAEIPDVEQGHLESALYSCRGCGRRLRSLEADGYCRRCNGDAGDQDVLEANRRAGAAARAAQRLRHPEWFGDDE